MNTREYLLSRKFSNPAQFPYGFSRSGDFTISQAFLLEQKGELLKALLADEVTNPTEEDLDLKQAILAGNKEHSDLAKIWLKYMSIKRSKISVTSSREKLELSYEVEGDSDDDWISDDPLDD